MGETEQIAPLMSSRELADYLGVPLQTVYVWSMRGTGPVGYVVGRHRRYRREDVDSWLERHQKAEPKTAA